MCKSYPLPINLLRAVDKPIGICFYRLYFSKNIGWAMPYLIKNLRVLLLYTEKKLHVIKSCDIDIPHAKAIL